MKTFEEIYEDIRNMEGTERYKLVKSIQEFTYNPNKEKSGLIIELCDELTKVKKDLEYLSGKVGLHDMYFNRLEIEKSKKSPQY
jgi:hypothetical protein